MASQELGVQSCRRWLWSPRVKIRINAVKLPLVGIWCRRTMIKNEKLYWMLHRKENIVVFTIFTLWRFFCWLRITEGKLGHLHPNRFASSNLVCNVWFVFFPPSQEVENLRKQAEIIPQLMAECETITAKLQVCLPDPFWWDFHHKRKHFSAHTDLFFPQQLWGHNVCYSQAEHGLYGGFLDGCIEWILTHLNARGPMTWHGITCLLHTLCLMHLFIQAHMHWNHLKRLP